jgi:hypothetical protein
MLISLWGDNHSATKKYKDLRPEAIVSILVYFKLCDMEKEVTSRVSALKTMLTEGIRCLGEGEGLLNSEK